MIKRPPDFIIGDTSDPYLRRWWIIPRNRWFNIYLHEFCRSDDDRALHDHPWWNLSIIISGRYLEEVPIKADAPAGPRMVLYRRRWIPIFRRATAAHSIQLFSGETAWTIFITGRNVRQWGFWCPQGWRHWKDFVSPKNKGEIGKGCE